MTPRVSEPLMPSLTTSPAHKAVLDKTVEVIVVEVIVVAVIKSITLLTASVETAEVTIVEVIVVAAIKLITSLTASVVAAEVTTTRREMLVESIRY